MEIMVCYGNSFLISTLRRVKMIFFTLPQKGLFCLHFDFSEYSTLLSKIEIRDAENSLQNAQVSKIYCPSG